MPGDTTRYIRLAADTASRANTDKLNELSQDVAVVRNEMVRVGKSLDKFDAMHEDELRLRTEFDGHVEAHKEKRKWWLALWGSIAALVAKAGFDLMHRNGQH